jgi:hypothetical protein
MARLALLVLRLLGGGTEGNTRHEEPEAGNHHVACVTCPLKITAEGETRQRFRHDINLDHDVDYRSQISGTVPTEQMFGVRPKSPCIRPRLLLGREPKCGGAESGNCREGYNRSGGAHKHPVVSVICHSGSLARSPKDGGQNGVGRLPGQLSVSRSGRPGRCRDRPAQRPILTYPNAHQQTWKRVPAARPASHTSLTDW